MPRGSKAKYSEKQKRKAAHIEEGYEKRGVSRGTAAARAWATVNKQEGGAKKKASRKPSKKASKKASSTRRRTKATARRKTKASRTRSAASAKKARSSSTK